MQPTMQAPSFLANRAGRGLSVQATAGIGGAQPPRVSIAANAFTLIDGAGNKKPHVVTMMNPQTQQMQTFLCPYLDAVVIGVNKNVSKTFYDTEYDPGADDAPPACFSDNGIGPSVQASKPQSKTCASCPNNQWGSDVSQVSGKQTKLCSDAKKLAIILPNDPVLYQLRIPPATLKNLKVYANTIGNYSIAGPDGRSRGADLSDVVTRITFDGQGKLKFEPVGFIDEAIATQMDAVTEEKMAVVIGTNDQAITALPTQGAPVQQIVHQPTPMQAPPSPPQPAPVQQFAPPPPAQAQFVAAPPVQMPVGVAPPPNGPAPAQFTPQAPAQPQAAPAAPRTRRGRGRAAAAPAADPGAQAAPAPQAHVVTGPPAMAVPMPQAPMQAPPQGAPAVAQWTAPAMAAPPGAPQQMPQQQFGMQPAPAAPDQAMQQAVLDAMNFKPPGQ